MQIVLFGTSADPPTIAHQEIIRWLAAKFVSETTQHENRVAVWAADNPFKVHGASLEQRSQMLELLIAEIDPSISQRIQVYPHLSSRRTIETLNTAKQIWSNAEFILVIGADLVQQLSQWYHIDELLSQVRLLIIPREGSEIQSEQIEILTNLGAKISIAPLTTPAISSTIARTSIKSIQGLTPAISKYIQTHNLYQT
jgi:nicotinate-nucleotide adenylyltransferase